MRHVLPFLALLACAAAPQEDKRPFTDTFDIAKGELLSSGRNPYFILEPGYVLYLEGGDEKEKETLTITVLDETKVVEGIETRIVEERETVNGKLAEVSRNYFAISGRTNAVYYFGEDAGGAWISGKNGARFGMIMPGTPLLGARHHQEVAPGVAMDRAEIVSVSETMETPAGTFKNVLKVKETNPLEGNKAEYKYYARGVGLLKDGGLKLVKYGFGEAVAGTSAKPEKSAEPEFTEVEIKPEEMPAPVAEVVKKLHPKGRIQEVKKETHGGKRVVYAIEIFIGEQQYDVEVTPKGKVLRNEAEK